MMTPERAAQHLLEKLPADYPKRQPIPNELIAQLCDALWAANIQPNSNAVTRRLKGVIAKRVSPGIVAWRKGKGLPEQGVRATTALPVSLEDLAKIIAKPITRAPLTAYDPSNDGRWPAPTRKVISYLGRIENASLRNAMALYALLKGDLQSFQTYSRIANFSSNMRMVMVEQNVHDVPAIDPNDFLFRIHEGKIGQSLSFYQRGTFISNWNDVSNTFETYSEQLSSRQRKSIRPFFIRPITDRRKLVRIKHWKTYDDARQVRVKEKTDAFQAQFHRVRFIAKMRLNQMRRFYDAVNSAIVYVKTHHTAMPYEFSYEETVVTERNRKLRQRVRLILWDTVSVHDEAVRKGFTVNITTARSRRHLGGLFSKAARQFHVEYCSTTCLEPGVKPQELWLIDLYNNHVFQATSNPMWIEQREKFNHQWGYESRGLWTTKSGLLRFTFRSVDIRFLQKLEGRCFIPHLGIYAASLFAHLVIRVQTVTGARLGEVQQIAQNPECIKQLVNVGPNGATRWLLRLIPKGRKVRDNYFIDEETKDCLMELVRFLREIHKTKKLPIVETQYAKTPPDRYLLQWNGRGIHQDVLNVMIRFMLHGLALKTADGKLIHITSHILRHGLATELAQMKVPVDVIAQILHQRDQTVTKYYARPTTTQVMNAAEIIFVDRVDVATEALRSPDEIGRMLKEAEGKIGALTEVLGGTCVVANLCPAKFACVGCSGNAPDPDKRYQIERKRGWAQDQSGWAKKQRLLAEERQLKQVIQDCDLVLNEMDLITIGRKDALQSVTINHQ
jgi:hypothetical protein